MSEIKNGDIYIIEDASLMWVKVDKAVDNYSKDGKEYTIDAIVSKASAKAFKAEFKKASVTNVEDMLEDKGKTFEEYFNVPDPQFEGGNYLIKLKKPAAKNGVTFNLKFRPKVYEQTGKGKAVDITTAKLVANGSRGRVSVRAVVNDFGTFAHLNEILVTDLIEFVRADSGGGNSFGVDVVDNSQSAPDNNAGKGTVGDSGKSPGKPPVDALDDLDLPF